MTSHRPPSWLGFALLWFAGIDLRLTILAVPPVIPLIHHDLALSETEVAALTGLPVLLFGAIAIPGSLLIARIGARRALIVGLIAVAFASALRGVGPSWPMLFAMTFAMGAGVAILQPSLPSLVSQWFPTSAALATAVYANGLLIGEALGASLTIPLVLPLTGGSWPLSFVVWAVPVLATAAAVILFTTEIAGDRRQNGPWWPDWRDARTWRLGLLQGGGSALYFACNAFVPDYLQAIGRPDLIGACLTALNTGQLPASLVILLFAHRLSGRRAPFLVAGMGGLLGLAALLLPWPATLIGGAAIAGFFAAFVLILTLALPPIIAAPDDVHRLSAGMFTIGYTLSFVVPLIGGAVWDITGKTAAAFLPGAAGGAIVLLMAMLLRSRDSRE